MRQHTAIEREDSLVKRQHYENTLSKHYSDLLYLAVELMAKLLKPDCCVVVSLTDILLKSEYSAVKVDLHLET